MTTSLDHNCPHEGCGAKAGQWCSEYFPCLGGTRGVASNYFHPERIAALNQAKEVEEEK